MTILNGPRVHDYERLLLGRIDDTSRWQAGSSDVPFMFGRAVAKDCSFRIRVRECVGNCAE